MRQRFGGSRAEGSARSSRWSGGCESRCSGSGSCCETASSSSTTTEESNLVRRCACRRRTPRAWTLNDSSYPPSRAKCFKKQKRRRWRQNARECSGNKIERFAQICECRFALSVSGSHHRKLTLSFSLYYSVSETQSILSFSVRVFLSLACEFQTITVLGYL